MNMPTSTAHNVADNHLEPLTWLRAIAAAFVVIHHSVLAARSQLTETDIPSVFFIADFLDLGVFAVYLFFALSGCTLTISNKGKILSSLDFVKFYVKRFLRIWPVYAASLIAYIIFIEIFRIYYIAEGNLWIELFLKKYSTLDITQYLLLIFNINGTPDLFNSSYWSLPIEFQYYLLLAPTLFLMRFKFLSIITPLCLGSILYFMYQHNIFNFNDSNILKMGFSFFGGSFLAVIYPHFKLKLNTGYFITIFLISILFLGCIRTNIFRFNEAYPFISDDWNIYGVFSLFIICIALITTTPQTKTKIQRFIEHYGEISYSIYLFHMLFIGSAVLLVTHISMLQGENKLLFILLFSLIGSYLIALATYKYLEKPSIEYGKRLFHKKADLTLER